MKNTKKILSLILAVCMIASLAISASAANTVDASGGTGTTSVTLSSTADGSIGGDPAATKMSVTVPTVLPIAVGTDGTVSTATDAKIVNNSFGAVKVNSVSIEAAQGWSLAAFGDKATLAHEKVNANKFGFQISLGNGEKKLTDSKNASKQTLLDSAVEGCYMSGVGDTSANSIGIAYDYADHSYSYGSWVRADDAQHKRTKSCSVCGDSSEKYADHVDVNGDGKCDDCGYSMTAVLTWDYGDGTFTTSQPYHAKLLLPDEPVKEGFTFDGWFTEKTGGTEVTGETVFTSDSPTTYYAHWSAIKTFSATVPVTLPLVVDESGNVHTGAAEIINASTGAVVVSSVSISSKNGWKLVPFSTNMAHEKVDAQLLGFRINDAQTTGNGDTETLALTAPWTIAANARLPIDYDAVVSAVSQPVTEQDVLNVLFVLEWDGE